MPSKSRAGLSKREVKRASAAKALTAKKSSVKSSPRIAPLAGAGPLMKGQTRVANSYGGGSQLQGAGPLLQGQTRVKDSYQGDSAQRRKEASKAASKIIPGLSVGNITGSDFGQTGTPIGSQQGSIRQGSSGLLDKLKRGAESGLKSIFKSTGDYYRPISEAGAKGNMGLGEGAKFAYDNSILTPKAAAAENDISALGQYLQESSQPDIPTGYGEQDEIFYNGGQDNQSLQSKFLAGQRQNPAVESRNPFGIPTANAAEAIMMPEDLSEDQKSSRKKFGALDNDPTLTDEMQFSQEQNELFGGGQMADIPGATTGNRSGRGSGMFGTGKGYQGNPLLDEYQSQLKGFRKQGNKMEDLYDDMLKSLDPTYDAYSADIKKSVDEELRQNLLQLASVMNANNTGDSEQRAQFMAQRQGQSEAQLGDLLRKLMLQKQEDAQGIKEKKVNSLSQLQDRQMTTREKMAQLMSQMQEAPRGRVSGRTSGKDGNRDAEFEKSARSLVQQVLMGRMNRDAAAKNLSTFFPDYDENVIYDLLPDNYKQ